MKQHTTLAIATLTTLAACNLVQANDAAAESVSTHEVSFTGGYFVNEDLPYMVLRAGTALNDHSSIGFQLGFLSDSQDATAPGASLSADLNTFTTGLYYTHYYPVAEFTNLYASASAGAAFSKADYDYNISGFGSGSGSSSDSAFYADATFGIEYEFSKDWIANVGFRLFHNSSLSFEGVELDQESILVGIEAGLTYTF